MKNLSNSEYIFCGIILINFICFVIISFVAWDLFWWWDVYLWPGIGRLLFIGAVGIINVFGYLSLDFYCHAERNK